MTPCHAGILYVGSSTYLLIISKIKVRLSSSSSLYCSMMIPFGPRAFLFFAFFSVVFNSSNVIGLAIAVLTGMVRSLSIAAGSKLEFRPKICLLKNSP